MKKLKSFFKNFNEFNQNKAENTIMLHLTEYESESLTTEQQLRLFNAVKIKFDTMMLKKKIEAERDAQLISYHQGEFKTTNYTRKANEINVN